MTTQTHGRRAHQPAGRYPVLILGAAPRMTVPIARALYRHGIVVDVATFSSVEHPVFSRAIRNFWRLPDPDVSSSEFCAALCQIICEHGHNMLIPANDVALTAIVEHYDRFNELLHVACPPPAIVRRILNKDLTLETARQCGIPIPRSIVVSDSAALSEESRNLNFPMSSSPAKKSVPMNSRPAQSKTPAVSKNCFPSFVNFRRPCWRRNFVLAMAWAWKYSCIKAKRQQSSSTVSQRTSIRRRGRCGRHS